MITTIFLDKILSLIDEIIGTQRLSLITYLILIFGIIFILTLILVLLSISSINRNRKLRILLSNAILIIILLSIILLLIGIISSIGAFHYSLLAIFSMLMIPIIFYTLVITRTNNNKSVKLRLLALILTILTIFLFGSRHLINGIEERETTSDMINIIINGYFKWSAHGPPYDLAPLDAILKVMLSYITGDNIFSAILASIMYTCYALTPFLLVYVLAGTIVDNFTYAIAIAILSLLSYPYSPIINVTTSSAFRAHLLALGALIFVLKSLLRIKVFKFSDYFVVIPLTLACLLMHPSSLGLVLYLALITLLLIYKKSLTEHNYAFHILEFSLIIYFVKVTYTAFIRGFVNFIQVLWNYIVNTFIEGEITEIVTRNPGYSGLPRLCLTGFATLLGYLAGLAFPILIKILRRKQLSVVEQLFMVTLVFYGAFALASVLTGLGGMSQSRIVINGAQPYMELALIIYLAALMSEQSKSLILIPLVLSVLATLITPNAIPQNYTIFMAAKAATINDHIIAYSFTKLTDKLYYVRLYNTCGDIARIIAFQEHEDVCYGLDSTMASVYYFIAPKVVSAKTYWDSCIMKIGVMPKDATSYIANRVFNAWLYAYYIYVKG